MSQPPDPYSRSQYRKLIAWGPRIQREATFLGDVLGGCPDRSVLDIGCGTGEHTAFFASQGCRAVGIDRSESMIADARDHEARGEGRFVLGDAADAPALLAGEPPFGMAICLGNALPHLQDEAELSALLSGIQQVLLPGAVLLVQLLNYGPVRSGAVRHLPLSFREGDDGEDLVFLRLMQPLDGGRVYFYPTTLVIDDGKEEDPVRIERSRRVLLRAWIPQELEPILEACGFDFDPRGDMHGGPYDPETSKDLVLLAHRR